MRLQPRQALPSAPVGSIARDRQASLQKLQMPGRKKGASAASLAWTRPHPALPRLTKREAGTAACAVPQ